MNAALAAIGIALLAVAWGGPLPGLSRDTFVAHMALHLLVMSVAAPLLAAACFHRGEAAAAGARASAAALVASLLDLVVVWAWHTPALHALARRDEGWFAIEQGSFLLAGIALWGTAFSGPRGAGVVALLSTAMHMALLGTLLASAPRPLFALDCLGGSGLSALDDQHAGGVLMLLVGGSIYAAGGLFLLAPMLHLREPSR